MRSKTIFPVIFGCIASVVSGERGEHKIQKIISLIKTLEKTSKKDQENDDITYEEASHTYQLTKEGLEETIADEKLKLEEATDLSNAKQNESDALKSEIEELESKMLSNTENQSNIESTRKSDNKQYLKAKGTLDDTIKALEECKTELAKSPDGFLQKHLLEKATTAALLADLKPNDPKARTYDSKTGNIGNLVDTLLVQFQDKLNKLEKEEQRKVNAKSLMIQSLEAEKKAMNDLKTHKENAKGAAEGVKTQADQDIEKGKINLDSAKKNLQDIENEYSTTTDNYKLTSKERREERIAMTKAIDLLQEVSGIRSEHVPVTSAATSFLQFLSETPKEKAVALLRSVATETHDAKLQKLAMEIMTAKGPFSQINNMIQKMIDHLTSEQREEDNHKQWCDNEIAVTDAAKEDKEQKKTKIEADRDVATTKKDENVDGKTNANKQISFLQNERKEETELRQKEHKNNEISMNDAKDAINAIQQALEVLQEWSSKGGNKTNGAERILTLLEETKTQYGTMRATVEAEETRKQMEFETSLADIKKEIAVKKAEIQSHDDRIGRLSQKISMLSKKKKHNDNALFEVDQYLNDLKPACIDDAEAYETRKTTRDKEKKALGEAKKILADAFKSS